MFVTSQRTLRRAKCDGNGSVLYDIAFLCSFKVCKAISMYEDLFELMHFSDQYVGQKKEEV